MKSEAPDFISAVLTTLPPKLSITHSLSPRKHTLISSELLYISPLEGHNDKNVLNKVTVHVFHWLHLCKCSNLPINQGKDCALHQYYRGIHCLTSEFHLKFHGKNRYRTNRKVVSSISVFQVKFNVEFTRQAVNFSRIVQLKPPIHCAKPIVFYFCELRQCCTSPQMIPGPQMIPDRKWSSNWTANDPGPQVLPILDRKWPRSKNREWHGLI